MVSGGLLPQAFAHWDIYLKHKNCLNCWGKIGDTELAFQLSDLSWASSGYPPHSPLHPPLPPSPTQHAILSPSKKQCWHQFWDLRQIPVEDFFTLGSLE